jgi:predicted acyltransferase
MSAETAVPLAAGRAPRLVSIDAYRGFVMLAMVSRGFGFPSIARREEFRDSTFWQALAYQFDHVPWTGCSFWDLIQPSFMFLVGTSMAFSLAARSARGQSYAAMAAHAAIRSIALIWVGIFLRSNGQPQTNFTLVDVTTQIGLGYFFLFLLWNRPRWVQASAAAAILIGYWLLFALWPLPPSHFDWSSVGVLADWQHLTGFAAHWDKNYNPAAALDVWLLNQLPQAKPFEFNSGGYATLNFVPSLATMIFGLLAGELLRSPRTGREKLWRLVMWGVAGLGVGLALHYSGVCPIVKRIWTPSWTVFAAGWTLLLLAAFYAVIELGDIRSWAFPFTVVGMNSIAIYCLDKLIHPWIIATIKTHLGSNVFQAFGEAYEPLVQNLVALLMLWLICYWMYRRKIFLRI